MNAEDEFTAEISEPCPEGSGVTIDDFVAYLPTGVYIFTPCREVWIGKSVNSRPPPMPALDKHGKPMRRNGRIITITATRWLDKNRAVQQMTWAPGLPMLIQDRLVVNGGWIEREGVTTFNLYRSPRIKPGDAAKAGPWLDHVHRVFAADDAAHIVAWLAHRVQRPGEKINHALVLGGDQGIGKDTLLEPIKHAIGPWNFHDVSPTHLLGRFNGFAKATILRVNEGRDLGEIDRFKFYDHTKIYTAAPPDVLRVDEKNLREHYIFNVLGFVITTNHRTDGLFLPDNDRRHYIAWSDCTKSDFSTNYWNELWRYYDEGGFAHVAAYLANHDISGFDPKAPPPKTAAFWEIANINQAPEDAELADVIDAMGQPDALTPKQLQAKATGATGEWLLERKSRRTLPHRLSRCGYVSIRNPCAEDGYWRISGSRQPVYAKASLTPQDRIRAATKLTG
jgi:Family of unknown function (DUF5906)